MLKKMVFGILALSMLTTACDVEIQQDAQLTDAFAGMERRVAVDLTTESEAPTTPVMISPAPVQFGPGTPVASPPAAPDAPSMELVWSPTHNGPSLGLLDGSVITGGFDIQLSVSDGAEDIARVEWFLNDATFRTDDLAPPYNIRYAAAIPLGTTFASDQGLSGSWNLVSGVHVARANVVGVDGSVWPVEAVFDVVTGTTAPSTTTLPASPTTTLPASPTTTTPVPTGDDRPVVYADANTVLDQPNTIYDFQFGQPGDVVIEASNVEARNIRGPGTRRIGIRNGETLVDSGFRNFEFTFAHVRMSDGAEMHRPYFIDGWDVNPQPNIGDNDIIQIYAYQGDIYDPLVDNVTAYGKTRPPGSDAHNDTLQIEGIQGGIVWNPTIINNNFEGASNVAIMMGQVGGLLTIEGNRLTQHPHAYFAVNGKDGGPPATVLFRGNDMVDGAGAYFRPGWSVHPDSEGL